MQSKEFMQTRAAIQAILVLLAEIKLNFDVIFSGVDKEQLDAIAKEVATPPHLNAAYKAVVASYNELLLEIFKAGEPGSFTVNGGDAGFPTTDVFSDTPSLTESK